METAAGQSANGFTDIQITADIEAFAYRAVLIHYFAHL